MRIPLNRADWERHTPAQNPFLKFEFFQALTESGCLGAQKGQELVVLKNAGGLLYFFVKSHSYGEYIFDWSWAQAYAKYGLDYYPKLTSLIPFTPVTTTPFIMEPFDEGKALGLMQEYESLYEASDFSSSHFLFIPKELCPFFEKSGYVIRESMQFHFFNDGYQDFEDFLKSLKGRKAKQIRHERQHPHLEIRSYTQENLTPELAVRMYDFYMTTIENKSGQDYLNRAFFIHIFQTMKANVLYVEATEGGAPIAGSLFFYDQDKIYGRYWGCRGHFPYLHFELCYYQGIDFCLKHKLKVFEAGAQGEHKIARGFRPTRTFSAHKIKHPAFRAAILDFIQTEKAHIAAALDELSLGLPFKSNVAE